MKKFYLPIALLTMTLCVNCPAETIEESIERNEQEMEIIVEDTLIT